jgi:hypothetical protein
MAEPNAEPASSLASSLAAIQVRLQEMRAEGAASLERLAAVREAAANSRGSQGRADGGTDAN